MPPAPPAPPKKIDFSKNHWNTIVWYLDGKRRPIRTFCRKNHQKISFFGQVREDLVWAADAGGILGHAGAAAANGVWQNFFVYFETSYECLLMCQRASSKVHFWPFYSWWVDPSPPNTRLHRKSPILIGLRHPQIIYFSAERNMA